MPQGTLSASPRTCDSALMLVRQPPSDTVPGDRSRPSPYTTVFCSARRPTPARTVTVVEVFAALPLFTVAVVLISASPGPAVALIVRQAALHGWRAAVPTVLGLEAGLFMWALAAGGGLTALIAASDAAYLVLRVVGAAFLVFLGVNAWRAGVTIDAATPPEPDAAPPEPGSADAAPRPGVPARRAFAQGAVVQLANPKAAAFLMALYPQFVPHDQPMLPSTVALASYQVLLETALYTGLAVGVARAGAWFRTPGSAGVPSSSPAACSSASESGWPPHSSDQFHGPRTGGAKIVVAALEHQTG